MQLIRAAPVGTKTARARSIVESEFSRTGAPSLTLAEQFDALVGDGKFSDPTEREFVENLIASHTRSRDAIDDWLTTNPRVPRAADLWDLPGGLCGAAALRLMRAVGVPAQACVRSSGETADAALGDLAVGT